MRLSRWKYESKVFFAHVRRNRQLNHQIISLKPNLTVIVKEPTVQAELLNEFYDSVFLTDNGQPIPTLPLQSVMMDILCIYSLLRP